MLNKVFSAAVLGGFAALLGLLVVSSNTFAFEEGPEKTIMGTVVEASTNDDGEVISVAIESRIEMAGKNGASDKATEEYLVGDTKEGHELLGMVGKQVKATGEIKTDADGNKTILVSKFTAVKDESAK
jgi:hypothetical protein